VKRYLIPAGAIALVAVLVIGLSQAGGGGGGSSKSLGGSCKAPRVPPGAPAALTTLQKQACQLLPGGAKAFKDRLASLRGYPVVVNKWASWCGPCRAEFPLFQKATLVLGRQVAFMGVDSLDNKGDAGGFLKKFPVAYPSYFDGSGSVAQVFNGAAVSPTTAFYDAHGKLQYLHQGEYPSEAKLLSDIRRYAIAGRA
jgi:cytochrome c biogenesis protein CcmG, thiol:disulfide interchange protein DsbE